MHPRLAKIQRELLEGSVPWEDGPSLPEMQKRHNRFLLKYAQENPGRAEMILSHIIPRFPFSDT